MPYIKKGDGRREKLRNGEPALIAGELNYQIFYYIKHYCIDSPCKFGTHKTQIEKYVKQFLGEKPNYQRYNDMTGVLIRCARELKRRLDFNASILIDVLDSYDDEIAKYEDIKIVSNGDVE